MTSLRQVLVLLAAGAALLAGCSTGDGPEGVATLGDGGSASTTPSPGRPDDEEENEEETALKFAQCMRDNGVPDFPDPEIDADGNIRLRIPPGSGANIDREAARKARDACAEHAPELRGGFSPEDQTRLQDSLLAYARCMRQNGYDMPDPDFSGDGGPFGIELDRDDPAFERAHAACEDKLEQLRDARAGE